MPLPEQALEILLIAILGIPLIAVFRKGPSTPPSKAQYKIVQAASQEHYLTSLKRLVKNWPFVLLIVTYGELVPTRYYCHSLVAEYCNSLMAPRKYVLIFALLFIYVLLLLPTIIIYYHSWYFE